MGGDRRAEAGGRVDPRARQRRHLGGPRRRADDGSRPAATASSSDAAASVGRGCSATWSRRSPGRPVPPSRTLGEVCAVMVDHARLLVEHLGEDHAMRDFRKHAGWYMSGYPVGPEVRRRFSMNRSLAELDDIIADARSDAPRSSRAASASSAVTPTARSRWPARRLARRPAPIAELRADVSVPDDDRRHGALRRMIDRPDNPVPVAPVSVAPVPVGPVPDGWTVVLASGSPRRRELLHGVGLRVAVRPADIDESVADRRVARPSTSAGSARRRPPRSPGPRRSWSRPTPRSIVDGEILEKPVDDGDARRMLRAAVGSHRTSSTPA